MYLQGCDLQITVDDQTNPEGGQGQQAGLGYVNGGSWRIKRRSRCRGGQWEWCLSHLKTTIGHGHIGAGSLDCIVRRLKVASQSVEDWCFQQWVHQSRSPGHHLVQFR
jgi:hypothetical protein